jgi:flagellar hook assembly protein FlgD
MSTQLEIRKLKKLYAKYKQEEEKLKFLLGLSLTPSSVAFSPNNDGVKDKIVFSITQKEALKGFKDWAFVIKDSRGRLVSYYQWKDDLGKEYVWRGKSRRGKAFPEGKYYYYISTTAPDGKVLSSEEQFCLLDLTPPRVSLTIAPFYLSPNNDGRSEQLEIKIKVRDATGIEKWGYQVKAAEGRKIYTWGAKGVPPESLTWDGKTEEGKVAPDGKYQYVLIVRDNAGNTTVTQREFIIDTTLPEVSVRIVPEVIDLDKAKPPSTVKFILEVKEKNPLTRWALLIKGKTGVEREIESTEPLPRIYRWDGRTRIGSIYERKGVYRCVLKVEDIGGNRGESKEVILKVKKREEPSQEVSKREVKKEVRKVAELLMTLTGVEIKKGFTDGIKKRLRVLVSLFKGNPYGLLVKYFPYSETTEIILKEYVNMIKTYLIKEGKLLSEGIKIVAKKAPRPQDEKIELWIER